MTAFVKQWGIPPAKLPNMVRQDPISVTPESLCNRIESIRDIYVQIMEWERDKPSYEAGSLEMPKLIFRVAAMSWSHQKAVKNAIKHWERFKHEQKITDLEIDSEQEIALAVYVFCYHDSLKEQNIEKILEELWLWKDDSELVMHIKELCSIHVEPSSKAQKLHPRF